MNWRTLLLSMARLVRLKPAKERNTKHAKVRARCHAAGFELSQSGRRYIVTPRAAGGPAANCGTLTEVVRFIESNQQLPLMLASGGAQ